MHLVHERHCITRYSTHAEILYVFLKSIDIDRLTLPTERVCTPLAIKQILSFQGFLVPKLQPVRIHLPDEFPVLHRTKDILRAELIKWNFIELTK